MYEVLLQTPNRAVGNTLTFKHLRRKTFRTIKDSQRYADQLTRDLKVNQDVYIVDITLKKTIQRFYYDPETRDIRSSELSNNT